MDTAEKRLLLAQDINPLNTDHTANLARLNTRWWQLSSNEADKQTHAAAAESYYKEALTLSPQNSVIRNEYARLAYDVLHDCQKSIDLYEKSIAIDPYYTLTYFARADVYIACAAEADEATRLDYYGRAAASLEDLRKYIVNSVVNVCQLQMGMTELKSGSVWNTMPAHV
ncbi:MAG: hypothetical protein P8183_15585, partial [Anaerolineae bacterium]